MKQGFSLSAILLAGVILIIAGGCAKKSATTPNPAPPAVSTNTLVTVISVQKAQCGGTVTSEGSGTVSARGICYAVAPKMPTLSDPHTVDGAGSGIFTSTMDSLTANTVYFARAYATSSVGTSYGDRVSFYANPVSHLFPGQNYGGGIIFYVDGSLNHGLIAATSEYSASWGCKGLSIPGTSVSLNTGHPNTNTIIGACTEKTIAARICTGLVINGKSDWFLPSREELTLLFLRKDYVGEFSNDNYWSSSQYDANQAYSVNFGSGSANLSAKNEILWIRAIRAF